MRPIIVYRCILFLQCVYFGQTQGFPFTSHENGKMNSQFPETQNALNKSCSEPTESCVFRLDHLLTYHEVYLDCQNWQCTCEPLKGVVGPAWDLKWDGRGCQISESGPCGESLGLELACQDGLLCIQSRCRSPRKFHKTPESGSCFDDIDCEKGLSCYRGPEDPGSQRKKTCGLPTGPTSVTKMMEPDSEATTESILRYFPHYKTRTKSIISDSNNSSGESTRANSENTSKSIRERINKIKINQVRLLAEKKRKKENTTGNVFLVTSCAGFGSKPRIYGLFILLHFICQYKS